MPLEALVSSIVSALVANLPYLAVTAIGALYAIVQWPKAPRPALLVLLGCVVMLGSSLLHPILFQLLIKTMQDQAAAGPQMGWSIAAFNFLMSIVRAAGLACMLFGAFIDRSYAPAKPPGPPAW